MLDVQQRPSAAAIRQARHAAGLTRREAAALVSMSPRALEDHELGRRSMSAATWTLLRHQLAGVAAESLLRKRLRERLGVELGGPRVRLGRQVNASDTARGMRDPAHADLLRTALELCEPRPTLEQLAGWCGFSIHSLRSWLKPPACRSHRPMPRHALRCALWEIAARDRGDTDWRALLRAC